MNSGTEAKDYTVVHVPAGTAKTVLKVGSQLPIYAVVF